MGSERGSRPYPLLFPTKLVSRVQRVGPSTKIGEGRGFGLGRRPTLVRRRRPPPPSVPDRARTVLLEYTGGVPRFLH